MFEDDREFYHLWYEYLRRSEDYKELCALMREGVHPLPIDKYKELDYIHINYLDNGDVHSLSFEQWYERKKRKIMAARSKSPIEGGFKSFQYRMLSEVINSHLQDFERNNQRKPSLEELLADIKRAETGLDMMVFYHLSINLTVCDTEELISKISKLIRSLKKNPWIKVLEETEKEGYEPVGSSAKARIHELNKYLKAYDLKQQGKTIREICEILEPAMLVTAERLRIFRRYISKAKKIIKNTANGQFPGKY